MARDLVLVGDNQDRIALGMKAVEHGHEDLTQRVRIALVPVRKRLNGRAQVLERYAAQRKRVGQLLHFLPEHRILWNGLSEPLQEDRSLPRSLGRIAGDIAMAGVGGCELFVAASSSDEANLAASLLAKHEGAPRTVVRVATAEDVTDETLDWITANGKDVAAVLVEPVQSRHPEVQPKAFVQALRRSGQA